MPLAPRHLPTLAFLVAAATALAAAAALWRPSAPPVPAPAIAGDAAPPASASVASPASAASPVEPAPGAPITEEVTSIKGEGAFQLHVFTLGLTGARLRMMDVHMSKDLASVLARTGASLVVNGGFFDRGQAPEGLVISEGRQLSARSDTLGGGVLAVAGGLATLLPAEGYVPAPGVTFAVQARPRLVEDGKSGIVRDDGKAAPRTALCVREAGRTLEVVVARGEAAGAGPTLALLADMLVSRGCQWALNLDGGPSTGAAWRSPDGAHDLPPRAPVRHALALWAAE
jgi:hypothetical protein